MILLIGLLKLIERVLYCASSEEHASNGAFFIDSWVMTGRGDAKAKPSGSQLSTQKSVEFRKIWQEERRLYCFICVEA